MRFKRVICVIAAVLCLCIAVVWINTPPIGSVVTDDVNDYLRVSKYVKDILDTRFDNTMPESIPDCTDMVQYHYQYNCGLLGDASFYIHLLVEYNDLDEFNNERERLVNLAPEQMLWVEMSDEYLVFSGNKDSFSGYLDDVIRDGSLWRFNIVSLNQDELKIEYTIADFYDGSDKNAALTDVIEAVYGLAE